MNDKISAKHLERAAYVYVRQSSLQQVRNNQESNRRQYALQDRASELGFGNVVIIDEDLGISGAGHHDRPGFSRLLTAVCDGRVGAGKRSGRGMRQDDLMHLVRGNARQRGLTAPRPG